MRHTGDIQTCDRRKGGCGNEAAWTDALRGWLCGHCGCLWGDQYELLGQLELNLQHPTMVAARRDAWTVIERLAKTHGPKRKRRKSRS